MINGTEITQGLTNGFVNMFGSYVLAGLAVIIIFLIIMTRHRLHLGTAIVIAVPMILAFAMSGMVPQTIGFVVVFGIGVLVSYVIYSIVSGGERP